MNRRQIIQGLSLLLGSFTCAAGWSQSESSSPPSPEGLILTWLNHSCVLFQGGAFRILVNPFRSLGCTAGYPPPKVEADLVLLSSRLFDEGGLDVVPGDPRVLFQSGAYEVEGINLQGVSMAHDDLTPKGQRFGTNVGWRWQQMGVDIVHLGGAAAPITREQEILLAKPDLLLIPVGGGPKNYDAQEAKATIETLQPKLVIPTMYRTEAAGPECELSSLNDFLTLFPPASIQKAPANTVVLFPENFPSQGTGILSFGETFAPPPEEKPSITFTPESQN